MKDNQSGFVVWFTGLSGSGKSTLSKALADRFSTMGLREVILDGDCMREGLCRDLGFTREDRKENVRRVSEVAKLFADNGTIVLAALISPFQADRQQAREIIGSQRFIEIYCNSPFEVCKARDVKGLYQQASNGNVPHFTGISSSYEVPVDPEIVLQTAVLEQEKCLQTIINFLVERGYCHLPNATPISMNPMPG